MEKRLHKQRKYLKRLSSSHRSLHRRYTELKDRVDEIARVMKSGNERGVEDPVPNRLKAYGDGKIDNSNTDINQNECEPNDRQTGNHRIFSVFATFLVFFCMLE